MSVSALVSPAAPKPIRVMVVDHRQSQIIADMLQYGHGTRPCQTLAVSNPAEALLRVGAMKALDVVVTGLAFPLAQSTADYAGLALAHEVKLIRPDIGVVLMTEKDDAIVFSKGLQARVFAFFDRRCGFWPLLRHLVEHAAGAGREGDDA